MKFITRLLQVALVLLCVFISAPAQAQHTPYPQINLAQGEMLVDFGSEWLIWGDFAEPAGWPNSEAIETFRPLTDILPATAEDTPDRRFLHSSPEAAVPWMWTSAMAPFEARSVATHESLAETWEREESRRVRRGRAPPQRTVMLYDTDDGATTGRSTSPDEGGLTSMYFTRTFESTDVDDIVSIQLNMEFSTGMIVYLNGQEILRHHIAPGHEAYGHVATPYWLADHVNQTTANRWERTWLGVDPSLLLEGQNVLSVAVYKRPSGGPRALFFDMQLEVYREVGLTKTPYLQSLQHNEITVLWETNVPSYGYVEFGPEGSDLLRVETAPELAGTMHEIRLANLQPDTRYFYRVHTIPVAYSAHEEALEPHVSEMRHFITSADPGTPFTFVAYGDNRTQDDVHTAITQQLWDDIQAEDARFVVHTGDLTTTGANWHQWQREFFRPALPLMGYIPYYTSLGNHEGNHEMYYRYMSLPGNEAWYSFEFGDAEFFALNSSFNYEPGSEQLLWLEDALLNSEAIWQVVFFHHPPYACTPSRKPGDENVQAYIVPLLEQYGVELVILGHDHLYGRSVDMNGVRYVISGGGGAPSYPAEPDAINEICIREYHYCVVDVEPDRLVLRSVGLGGVQLDRLELQPND